MKIRLTNVVKEFQTFRAVHGVSLDIESGGLVALLLIVRPRGLLDENLVHRIGVAWRGLGGARKSRG